MIHYRWLGTKSIGDTDDSMTAGIQCIGLPITRYRYLANIIISITPTYMIKSEERKQIDARV